MPALQRRLGVRDVGLIVIGGIVGSGIFMNPAVVARYVRTPGLIMAAWAVGGLVALAGAAISAELAARRPLNGGVYAYLRDAIHPSVAFVYGWTLLLLTQSGGAAASAVTFAVYFLPLTGLHWAPAPLAIAVIALLTVVNCLGVRAGALTQHVFVVAKVLAIGGIIAIGLFAPHAAGAATFTAAPSGATSAFGLALVPVFFAYLGWSTASFMTAELRDPARNLPRAMMYGVLAVVGLYLAINAICIYVLGASGLAATHTPASDVVAALFGPTGARIMAAVVAISTLGFVSNQILTSPRVYYQMAADGVFFKALGRVSARTHVPTIAIALQGIAAIVIALSGEYDTILNWVTSADFIILALMIVALLVFRSRDAKTSAPRASFTIWGGWLIPVVLIVLSLAIVVDVFIKSPRDTAIGLIAIVVGFPVYWIYRLASVTR